MEYLRDQGFSQPTLNERVRAFLLSSVASATLSDTIEGMWLKLGAQLAYPVFTVDEIQRRWASGISGISGTWNDVFDGLPGFNMASNGTFIDLLNWILGTGWSIAGSLATKLPGSTADLSQSALVPEVGATYRITATYVILAGTFYSRIGNTQSSPHTVSGTYVDDITASNALPFAIRGGSTASGTVTNISVRRL